MNWINAVQDRDRIRALVNTVIALRVPENVWKVFSICTTGRFSR
jgi:hypothetical protein